MNTNTETKKIRFEFTSDVDDNLPIEDVSTKMDQLTRHRLSEVPWSEYPYKPEVEFSLMHNGSSIFLKYYVKESSVQVAHRNINELVHKDSCVEFFFGFDGESEYYNYEFNCLGVCFAGFGKGRHGRVLIPEEVIKKIRIKSILKSIPEPETFALDWELTIAFPMEVFHFHKITSWNGRRCRGNFYKCGDDLPTVHFLSWNNIKSTNPDFHRPEYFGQIFFE